MTKKKKWEIDGLSARISLNEAANKVLSRRIRILDLSIKKYFKDNSAENLHEVRIAIRRLRYNMEIFLSCFGKKKYLRFYKTIIHLQDLTGSKRDFDVLLENLNLISTSEKLDVEDSIKNIIADKIVQLKVTLELELKEFSNCKELKDFQKLVIKQRSQS